MAEEFLCDAADLTSGQARKFELDGFTLALARVGEELYCIDDICTHGAFSLSEGELDISECALECPKHGSLFDLRTGEPISLPAIQPVMCYELSQKNGQVYVKLPDKPAG